MKTTPPAPEASRPVGRPNGCTPEMVAHLCSFIRLRGFSDSAAALQAGLSTSTLSRWKQDYPELTLALLQARQEFRAAQLDLILAAAQSKNGWRAAAWLLLHVFPEDYAPRADQRAASRKHAIATGAMEPTSDSTLLPARELHLLNESIEREFALQNSRNSPAPAAAPAPATRPPLTGARPPRPSPRLRGASLVKHPAL